ncbi:MAG: amino acid permease [Acidobacteria bacterium]|nr:amino acid permease [Acidobacteriota bacterium]
MEQGSLKRQLGLWTATALVVGEVIAVGIFLTPAGMAKSLGSPLWLLLVWVLMGAMALCGALCYAELAARYPEAGGGYVYLREAYGERVAFLYGWMSFLVMDPGITAALAVGMASYLGFVVPLSTPGLKLVAIACILALAAINILGVRAGGWLMRWLTVLKLGLLLLILLWGFGLRLGDWSNFVPFAAQRAHSEPLVGALAGALIAAFFSFGGWWDLSKLAGEVKEPARNLPRAMIYGVVIVTLVYILTSAVFMYLIPVERVTSGETFAAQAGEILFGGAGGRVFALVVVVSVLGSLAGVIMAAPRVYYAMARDGVFLPFAAEVNTRFRTPARAIAMQAVLASVLAALGNFKEIVAYFVFVVVLFLALTVAAVFVLRRRQQGKGAEAVPGYRLFGYPFTPLIFLALIAVLLIMLLGSNIRNSLLGVLVVALGLPIYQLLYGKRKALV